MAHFDICPRCEAPTKSGPVDDFPGDGLYCPRCGWQAVTVKWVAAKVNAGRSGHLSRTQEPPPKLVLRP